MSAIKLFCSIITVFFIINTQFIYADNTDKTIQQNKSIQTILQEVKKFNKNNNILENDIKKIALETYNRLWCIDSNAQIIECKLENGVWTVTIWIDHPEAGRGWRVRISDTGFLYGADIIKGK